MGFNAILKTKRVYMLYLLPFILAAIAFLRFTFGPEDFSVCLDLGVISIPDFQEQGGLWWKEIGVLALLCLSFLVFFVADRYKFLSHITVLPAVIYALLCIGVICRYGMSNYLVAALCVVLAVARLQSAIVNTQSNAPVFGFGLFSTLAVLLCPKLIMLIVWAIIVLPFSGRAALKDLVALFIGIFSALFFTGCYYFLTDRLATLPDVFVQALTSGQVFWKIMPEKVVAFVVIGVLIVVSLYNVVVNYPMAIVAQRRGMLSMLSMLLFVGSSLFFIPFNCHGITLITAIPLSYMFTQYFISHRTRWLGNVLFLLFIAACVLLVL